MKIKRMFTERRRYKFTFILVLGLTIFSFLWIYYHILTPYRNIDGLSMQRKSKFSDGDVNPPIYKLNINNDVLVFLHIQKTGGSTFGKHLVNDLSVKPACSCSSTRKRCDCHNRDGKTWLFSRYSTGWQCGLHADWTELKSCVNQTLIQTEGARKRRYHYITMLRSAERRYLSEWRHVKRGNEWASARLHCNGRQATLDEVPYCFSGSEQAAKVLTNKNGVFDRESANLKESWKGVELNDFLSCEDNLAHNRQTRMLSNLRLVQCYNRTALTATDRGTRMLKSAKRNLKRMSFFGLVERQHDSQYLFERTFSVQFSAPFTLNVDTHASNTYVSKSQWRRVRQRNQLDAKLYTFALKLFNARLKTARMIDRYR